ncbi:hypothetical protein [Arenibaculum sp.]|jgi:hypothetical protein|uniref:hypothetical protein n=1 Tax=Arenibaculum sp. TaxID=2865862 RepID=UPI002E0E8623|nr:hypothetical protein [Arenibaculum sp.]
MSQPSSFLDFLRRRLAIGFAVAGTIVLIGIVYVAMAPRIYEARLSVALPTRSQVVDLLASGDVLAARLGTAYRIGVPGIPLPRLIGVSVDDGLLHVYARGNSPQEAAEEARKAASEVIDAVNRDLVAVREYTDHRIAILDELRESRSAQLEQLVGRMSRIDGGSVDEGLGFALSNQVRSSEISVQELALQRTQLELLGRIIDQEERELRVFEVLPDAPASPKVLFVLLLTLIAAATGGIAAMVAAEWMSALSWRSASRADLRMDVPRRSDGLS